jgi:uncharacterized protein YcbK (DUF882 family)
MWRTISSSARRLLRLLGVYRAPASLSLAAFVVAFTVARSTTADPPTERASGFANRKEWPPRADSDDENDGLSERSELETWATLVNVHTGEALPLSGAEPSFNRFCEALADRTTASKTALDPRLLELLRQIAIRHPGARIELVSGYRSPKLNEMLRKKGHRVASHSQHSLGHAVDFRVIGLTPSQMKQVILKVGWDGGIGQYDKSSDLFVHADVGPKREWYERGR